MSEGWCEIFSGVVDGYDVSMRRFHPSGELCVETTQPTTEITGGYTSGSSTVMPHVISQGDPVEIEASTPEELEIELLSFGFSAEGSAELRRLATEPSA